MHKGTLLLGAGIGFILGSRVGHGPYQQLDSRVRAVTHRPDVQDKVGQFKGAAKHRVAAVAHRVVPGQSSKDGPAGAADQSPESYVDPQDLQFSTAAARKEELVDELLEDGVPPAEMAAKEDELRQSGLLSEPSAGNKAKPS
jgi:hypothetical protein